MDCEHFGARYLHLFVKYIAIHSEKFKDVDISKTFRKIVNYGYFLVYDLNETYSLICLIFLSLKYDIYITCSHSVS